MKRSYLLALVLCLITLFCQGCLIPVHVDCGWRGTLHVLVYDETSKQRVDNASLALVTPGNKIGFTDENGYFAGEVQARWPDMGWIGKFTSARPSLFIHKDNYCNVSVEFPRKKDGSHLCLIVTLKSEPEKQSSFSAASISGMESVSLGELEKRLQSEKVSP